MSINYNTCVLYTCIYMDTQHHMHVVCCPDSTQHEMIEQQQRRDLEEERQYYSKVTSRTVKCHQLQLMFQCVCSTWKIVDLVFHYRSNRVKRWRRKLLITLSVSQRERRITRSYRWGDMLAWTTVHRPQHYCNCCRRWHCITPSSPLQPTEGKASTAVGHWCFKSKRDCHWVGEPCTGHCVYLDDYFINHHIYPTLQGSLPQHWAARLERHGESSVGMVHNATSGVARRVLKGAWAHTPLVTVDTLLWKQQLLPRPTV